MKKLIFMLAITFLSLGVYSQASFTQTASNLAGVVVNAGSDTMNYSCSNTHSVVSVQPKFVKNSGAAAGTATLYYSVDGVNYYTTSKTLSLTDITTNSTVWEFLTPAKKFRIIVTGGTTMNLTCSAKIITN